MPNKEARLPVVLGTALVVTCTFSVLIAAEAVGRPKARTAADLRELTGRKYSALEQDWLFHGPVSWRARSPRDPGSRFPWHRETGDPPTNKNRAEHRTALSSDCPSSWAEWQ